MNWRFYRTLPGRMVGLYLAMACASLGATTWLFYGTTRDLILSSVQSHLRTIAATETDLISRWMQERVHDVDVVAKNATVIEHTSQLVAGEPETAPPARRALAQLLRLVRDQYGAYHDIFIFGRDKRLLASSRGDGARPAIDDALLFDAVRAGRQYASDAYLHPEQTSLALTLASPIETRDDELLGAVVAVVDLRAVNQITDSMQLMSSGEAYLVNQQGVFLTHRDRRRVLRDDISRVSGIAAAISGQSGVGVYPDYRDVPVVGAYQWMPRWRWGLVAEVDRAEALAPVDAARRSLLLIVGLVTAAVFLGTLLLVRSVVRPLRELTRAVQAVASGQLEQHLEIAGDDEVAYLTRCFNQMATNLAEAHSAMDERIHQATSSLAQKNAQLAAEGEHLARLNEQLQAANRELEQERAIVARTARFAVMGETAAGIAHEINNPLTTMKNLVHSLGAAAGDDGGIVGHDLGVLGEEIEKINRLVKNFLKYARPPKANIRPVHVPGLVEQTIRLLEPQARQKQLAVAAAVDVDLPDVLADQEQLGQVLVNLMLNAIQASPPGGEVRLTARAVFAEQERSPSRVEIAVADQGPGIDPGARDKVFSPFFTTKAEGSGLGLAISHRIVEEHGGTLTFSSVPEAGTTFVLGLSRLQENGDESDSDRG
ncbi:MAG: HAMP domain-containing protein [Deltaproteobacteria bacterium]|nr:HAMP domain-containing protein [Deltaproteobacteria bacterium]